MLLKSRVVTIALVLMVFIVLRSFVSVTYTGPSLPAVFGENHNEEQLVIVAPEKKKSDHEGSAVNHQPLDEEEEEEEEVEEQGATPVIIVSADEEELMAEEEEPHEGSGSGSGEVLPVEVNPQDEEDGEKDPLVQTVVGEKKKEQEMEEEEEDEGPADDDYVYHKEAIPEPKLPSIRFTKDPKLTRLFFFAVVASFEEPVLISQFLDHYLALGVHPDHMHIDFHVGSRPKQDHSELLGLFAQRGITHVTPWEGVWSDPEKLARGEKALERMGVGPGDWILHVDSDEFQEYPMALGDFLAECDELGVNATAGHFLDRLTEDGSLPPVTETTTRDDFPLGCSFTKYGMNANHNKLGPYKYGMKVFSGGYHGLHPTDKTNEGKLVFRALRIHHVKWFDSVVPELSNRKNGVPKETLALAEHIEKHNGKICVSCPEIKCQKVTKLPKIPTPKEARVNQMNDILFRYVLWVPPEEKKPLSPPEPKKAN